MRGNSCEIRAGRLMEIRVAEGYRSLADVDDMRRKIGAAFEAVPAGESVVISADWRHCRLMAAEASDAVGKMMGSFNARIERSGILSAPDSPIAAMQILRVIRESQHPHRRLFYDTLEISSWLGELLTPDETFRLREFLTHSPAG